MFSKKIDGVSHDGQCHTCLLHKYRKASRSIILKAADEEFAKLHFCFARSQTEFVSFLLEKKHAAQCNCWSETDKRVAQNVQHCYLFIFSTQKSTEQKCCSKTVVFGQINSFPHNHRHDVQTVRFRIYVDFLRDFPGNGQNALLRRIHSISVAGENLLC